MIASKCFKIFHPRPRPVSCNARSGLCAHRIRQRTDPVDIDGDPIAVLEKNRGSRFMPTPPGVPVRMMSPGNRVANSEIVEINVRISKIN